MARLDNRQASTIARADGGKPAAMVHEPVEATRPLSIDQVIGHRRPADPQISPDGSRVLFTLRPASREAEHKTGAIWAVDVESGEPFQFTTGDGLDDAPRWSPDGRSIAFLSDRAERGVHSVYVMPANGGEAVRVSGLHGELEDLSWSPDGTRLALLRADPKEDRAESEMRASDARVRDTDFRYRRLWVINLAAPDAGCVSPPDKHIWHYAWSPDGARLALDLSDTPRADDMFQEMDIVTVTHDGRDLRHVSRKLGNAWSLVWSADGSYLAYRHSAGRVINGDYVYTVAVSGGDPVCLTSDYSGTVEAISSIDAGAALLLTGAEGFNSAVYRLSWNGEMTALASSQSGVVRQVSASRGGRRIAMIREDATNAPDVWVVDGPGKDEGQPRRRTRLNPEIESAALGQSEAVRWSSDGMEIDGLLLKPYGYEPGRRYPLVVQIHGGPTARWSERFLASWHDWGQMLAGRGFAVLLPNPRGSTGRGPAFSNALFGDVGGGEYRDIVSGVDAMVARGIADPDRLGVGGWSWGGYLTAWTITQTDRFKAAVVGAGPANLVSDNSLSDIPSGHRSYFERLVYEDPEPYWDRSPMKHLRHAATPTLILHGEADERVAPAQGIELYVGLRMLGVETRLVTYPREGHEIEEREHQRDLIERMIDWYTRHLMA
jgi:dipeptidyl aminopeptidase/acylaminoacyl peptidase